MIACNGTVTLGTLFEMWRSGEYVDTFGKKNEARAAAKVPGEKPKKLLLKGKPLQHVFKTDDRALLIQMWAACYEGRV